MTESAIYVLEKMSHGFRRIGRAQGGGFYDYPQGDAPALWPGLRAFEKGRRKYPAEDIADRLVYAQLIESMRCLQEGVIASAQDADTASVHGWGFPAYRGGVAKYLDQVGVAGFVGRARELAQRYGERFEPPALLVRLAAEGKSL